MIVTEIITKENVRLVKTYSDEGRMIACGLEKFVVAYDPEDAPREYEETEQAIPGAEVSADEALAEIKEVLEA